MKGAKITYWITTAMIFAFEGVMPALTVNSEMAKQGVSHLGYPEYFRIWLTVFKVAGAIILIIPAFKGRIKEWAYAGFAFDFIFAAISHTAVDGFGGDAIFALVAVAILAASYFSYHKMQQAKA